MLSVLMRGGRRRGDDRRRCARSPSWHGMAARNAAAIAHGACARAEREEAANLRWAAGDTHAGA